ncbi:hypothetical protein ABIA45_007226 [Bradyrhizobium sp. USDA 336]|uniref:Uncharacterized protein n=1 Tax=Bradyrhizobium yuanmingense TaxID=108015 RepID=A0ABV4GM85_9BRAD
MPVDMAASAGVRAGRDHDCTRLKRDEIDADRVIPDDLRLFTEEIARNIEHE